MRRLAFHRSGKPRTWVLLALFKDGKVRPTLRRVAYKKSGRVRPEFANWTEAAREKSVDAGNGDSELWPEELILRGLKRLDETTKSWRTKEHPDHILDLAELTNQLSDAAIGPGGFVISVSHDDYTVLPGGVQVCIQREQKHAADRGQRYLHICPYYALPRLANFEDDPDTIVTLTIDGQSLGACRMSTVIEWVSREKQILSVVVHHLLGHLPEQIVSLVQATGSRRCIFWLHDYFSICSNFLLQRNDLVFCGAPPVASNACMICVYGQERAVQSARIRSFFETLEVHVASPSKVAADLWLKSVGLPHAALSILPHMDFEPVARNEPTVPAEGPVIIAFLGTQADHKGWPLFVRLMQEFADDSRFGFVVLSSKRPKTGEARWRSVHVTGATPDAMSDAVVAESVDLVLHWPSWPETFSFTTLEAIIGGAAVITHAGSGNVARVVEETGYGAILEDEDHLRSFLRNGQATALAERRRASAMTTSIVPKYSQISFSLIDRG